MKTDYFEEFMTGESGIRTHGICKDSSDFKSDAIDQLCHLAKLFIKKLKNAKQMKGSEVTLYAIHQVTSLSKKTKEERS